MPCVVKFVHVWLINVYRLSVMDEKALKGEMVCGCKRRCCSTMSSRRKCMYVRLGNVYRRNGRQFFGVLTWETPKSRC